MLKRVSLLLLVLLLGLSGSQPLVAKMAAPFEASRVVLHESTSEHTLTESTFVQVNEWGSVSPNNWEVALHTSGAKRATFFFHLPEDFPEGMQVRSATLKLSVTSYGGHPLDVVVANSTRGESRRVQGKGQLIELNVTDCLQEDQFVIDLVGRAVDNVSTGAGLSTAYGPVRPVVNLTLVEKEPMGGDILGATWGYYSHRADIDWGRWQDFCQSNFRVDAVPTIGSWCEVGYDGQLHWTYNLIASCNRQCTTCPDTSNFAGCNMVTCSSGWWGDVDKCSSNVGDGSCVTR